MLPRDFFVSDSQNEATIEAIACKLSGPARELLANAMPGSRGSCGTSRSSPFLGTISAQAHDFARMAPLYKDSDSSLWNFRTRTTFIARLIKGCRVDVRAGCLISEITQHFQSSNEHFIRLEPLRAFSCCSHRRAKCPS